MLHRCTDKVFSADFPFNLKKLAYCISQSVCTFTHVVTIASPIVMQTVIPAQKWNITNEGHILLTFLGK